MSALVVTKDKHLQQSFGLGGIPAAGPGRDSAESMAAMHLKATSRDFASLTSAAQSDADGLPAERLDLAGKLDMLLRADDTKFGQSPIPFSKQQLGEVDIREPVRRSRQIFGTNSTAEKQLLLNRDRFSNPKQVRNPGQQQQ
jgi:hypothetical protein